ANSGGRTTSPPSLDACGRRHNLPPPLTREPRRRDSCLTDGRASFSVLSGKVTLAEVCLPPLESPAARIHGLRRLPANDLPSHWKGASRHALAVRTVPPLL